MLKLTARQEQILNLIKNAIENTGFPPTRAEIAAELGFRSANAAEEHLQALARKGAIEISPGTSRGIRLRESSAARREHRAPDGPAPSCPDAAEPAADRPRGGGFAHPGPGTRGKDLPGRPGHVPAKPDYLLKVRGMSMRDAGILDGDLLAVRRADQARNGQIVVARLADEVTVKRYQKTGSVITLFPENPEFEPIIVKPENDQFALEGLAVGLLRSWN
jgi:repressor LexA